jgi:hypothetical protein
MSLRHVTTATLLAAAIAAPAFAQSGGDAALITEAVQILPADLRDGATVVRYDAATGARKVLRQGTNFVECQPVDPADGFARCYHKLLGPRRDLEAKLKAQKKTEKEIGDAVAAATKDGTLAPMPQGLMSYRFYGKRDRIQHLWVMSLLARGLLQSGAIVEAAPLAPRMLTALEDLGGGYIEVVVRRTAAEAFLAAGQSERGTLELQRAQERLDLRAERITDEATRARYRQSQLDER